MNHFAPTRAAEGTNCSAHHTPGGFDASGAPSAPLSQLAPHPSQARVFSAAGPARVAKRNVSKSESKNQQVTLKNADPSAPLPSSLTALDHATGEWWAMLLKDMSVSQLTAICHLL